MRTFTFSYLDSAPMHATAYCHHCRRWVDWLRMDVTSPFTFPNHARPHQEINPMSTATQTQHDDPTVDGWRPPTAWTTDDLIPHIKGFASDILNIVRHCHAIADDRGWCGDYDTIALRIAGRMNYPSLVPRRSGDRQISLTTIFHLEGIGNHRDMAEVIENVRNDVCTRGLGVYLHDEVVMEDVTPGASIDQALGDGWRDQSLDVMRRRAELLAVDGRLLVRHIARYGRDRYDQMVPRLIARIAEANDVTAPWFPEQKAPPREITFTVTVRPNADDTGTDERFAENIQEALQSRLPSVQQWRVELTRDAPAGTGQLPHEAWTAMSQNQKLAHVQHRRHTPPAGFRWDRNDDAFWSGLDEVMLCDNHAAHGPHPGATHVTLGRTYCPGLVQR